jgi:hypothetical protein
MDMMDRGRCHKQASPTYAMRMMTMGYFRRGNCLRACHYSSTRTSNGLAQGLLSTVRYVTVLLQYLARAVESQHLLQRLIGACLFVGCGPWHWPTVTGQKRTEPIISRRSAVDYGRRVPDSKLLVLALLRCPAIVTPLPPACRCCALQYGYPSE